MHGLYTIASHRNSELNSGYQGTVEITLKREMKGMVHHPEINLLLDRRKALWCVLPMQQCGYSIMLINNNSIQSIGKLEERILNFYMNKKMLATSGFSHECPELTSCIHQILTKCVQLYVFMYQSQT